MAGLDFINGLLVPWLEAKIAVETKNNQHNIAGAVDAMKAMTRFMGSQRMELFQSR